MGVEEEESSITIDDILKQAESTATLIGINWERPGKRKRQVTNSLWEYAFATYRAAEEDGEHLTFTVYDLEEAFERRYNK